MVIAPQKLREIVFQLLYSVEFGGSGDEEMTELLMHELRVSKKVMREALERKGAVCENKETIDSLITQHSKSYEFSRIPCVERNILRLGIYELLYASQVPGKVAIAEAIRMTRKFATAEAALFVNAVLDSVYTEVTVACQSLQ